MAGAETSESEPRPLGLDRLSPRGLEVFVRFVREKLKPGDRLLETFFKELCSLSEVEGRYGAVHDIISNLMGSNDAAMRQLACRAVPYFAEQDPETGFRWWGYLATDEVPEVADAAAQAIIDSVDVLALEPEKVSQVMEQYLSR